MRVVLIDLTETPASEPLGGDPATRLAALRSSLAALQLRQTAHRKRLILIVEGWEATGKRALMRQVLASLDPCSTEAHCSGVAPIRRDRQHWLAEYWGRLPMAGHSTIFYRSWYRRLVEERSQRDMDDDPFSRACDEINEFEAQQRDHETTIVKFFLHCSADVQRRRTARRMGDDWERYLVEEREEDRYERIPAWNRLFEETDTRWAPWTLIDAEDSTAAQVRAMQHLVDTLDSALPAEPPVQRVVSPHEATVVDFASHLAR